MRGVNECYLCGGDLKDPFNRFDASGIMTHHICPMAEFPYTGRTRSGHLLHLWGNGRTACGLDASKSASSVGMVNCQRCQQASRAAVLKATARSR